MYEEFNPKGIHMKIRGDDIPLQCFDNNSPVILTIEQIRKLLTNLNYLWLYILNRYWWNVGGYQDSKCLNDIKECTNGPQNLARLVHTHGPLMLTKKELTDSENGNMEISAFELRAHRFYKTFGETFPARFRPFHQVKKIEPDGTNTKAYQMYNDRHWLVVAGVLPDSGHCDNDIDWLAFKKIIDDAFLGPDSNNK